jgi:phosphatidylglycerol:prolipoprotein diacylglycerol transferase
VFPTIYHFVKDLTGLEIGFLQILNTFGFFVAISIAGAFMAMASEMKRRTAMGQFDTVLVVTETGKPFPIPDYILNGGLAFIFGYKLVWLAINAGEGFVPQEHIFTLEGSWLMGLLLAIGVVVWRYRADMKQRLPEPKKTETRQDADWHMGNITTIALLSGFLGAKVFHILENPAGLTLGTFVTEIFSTGGWTFYGGLICGAAGVLIYCSRKKLSLLRMLDSGGPAMMLSYGIGRFGCHFSGDGDWGIANTSPRPGFLSWLPDWAWSYTYPNNVLGGQSGPGIPSGMVPIKGCEGDYCFELATPVYPTPIYEAFMGIGLFLILWYVLRKKNLLPGNLFAWYMIFAGIERFLIESIREHGESLYKLGGLVFSQAQLISVILAVAGSAWLLLPAKFKGRFTSMA